MASDAQIVSLAGTLTRPAGIICPTHLEPSASAAMKSSQLTRTLAAIFFLFSMDVLPIRAAEIHVIDSDSQPTMAGKELDWIYGDLDVDGKPDAGFRGMLNWMDVIEVHPLETIFEDVASKPPNVREMRIPLFQWMQLLNQGHRSPSAIRSSSTSTATGFNTTVMNSDCRYPPPIVVERFSAFRRHMFPPPPNPACRCGRNMVSTSKSNASSYSVDRSPKLPPSSSPSMPVEYTT